MEGVPDPQSPARTRVFVSYSRKDSDAVDALVPTLQAQGYEVVVDRKDIAAAEVWRRRLEDLILDSDAVVFVISPHSIHSDVCGWEVERTIAYGKKLVPIVWQSIDAHACPPEIADRNWVAWERTPGDATPGPQTIEALRVAIERDIAWERERTVWIGRAIRWDRALRAPGRLLRGEEVVAAEAWAAGRPTSAAALPDVLLAYLSQSRERERMDRDHLRSITGRAFVTPIINAIRDREPDRALRLLATAMVLAQDPDLSVVPQLWTEGARCLMQLPMAAVGDRSAPAAYDPDGDHTVFGVSDDCHFAVCQEVGGAVRFVDLAASTDLWSTTFDFRVRKFAIVDGSVIAVGVFGEIVRLNVASGAVEARAGLRGRVDTIRFVEEERVFLIAVDRSVMRFALDGDRVECVRQFGGEVVDVAYCAATGCGLAVVIPPEGNWVAESFGVDEGEQYPLDDDVRFACFSKDGSRICLAERLDAEVFVAGQSGPPVRVRHSGKATATGEDLCTIALSNDGAMLLTAANDGTARVWDTTSGAELHRFDHVDEALIVEAAFGPDMQTVLTVGTDCTARLWSLQTGEELMRVSNKLNPSTTGWSVLGFDSAGLSSDGQRLWSSLPGGLLQVWPVRRLHTHLLSATVTSHVERFSRARFFADGQLAVLRGGRTLQVFNDTGERLLVEKRFPGVAMGVRIFEDGGLVVARLPNASVAVALREGGPSWTVQHRARPETAAYLPVSDVVAVGGGDYGKDGYVELISRSGSIVARSEMPGWVSALGYHRERRLLLIGDVQGHFMAWTDDARREPVWMTPFSGKIDAFAMPPQGRHFYAVSQEVLWRVHADDRRERITKLTSSTRSMVCDPSDRLLFVEAASGPQVIDLRRGALLLDLEAPQSFDDDRSFQQSAIAPDWRSILIVTHGGQLLTYDVDGLLALGEAPREAIAA